MAERLRKVRAGRLNAVPLGGVVACRDKCNAGLAREVHVLLRDLAGHVDVDAKRQCRLEVALRRAGPPRAAASISVALAVTPVTSEAISARPSTGNPFGQ